MKSIRKDLFALSISAVEEKLSLPPYQKMQWWSGNRYGMFICWDNIYHWRTLQASACSVG